MVCEWIRAGDNGGGGGGDDDNVDNVDVGICYCLTVTAMGVSLQELLALSLSIFGAKYIHRETVTNETLSISFSHRNFAYTNQNNKKGNCSVSVWFRSYLFVFGVKG